MLRKCVPFASRELVITISRSRVQWNAAYICWLRYFIAWHIS